MPDLSGTILGYTSWTGCPPMSARDADGNWFRGLDVKDSGDTMYYIVFKIDSSGNPTLAWCSPAHAGMGSIAVQSDGNLWATYFVAAPDGSASTDVMIPGFATVKP